MRRAEERVRGSLGRRDKDCFSKADSMLGCVALQFSISILCPQFIIPFEQEGIFEMDYQMRLRDRSGGSGGCVSRGEYVGWRMSGDAFPFDDDDDDDDDDQTRKVRNPTLVSSVMTRERRTGSRSMENGFW